MFDFGTMLMQVNGTIPAVITTGGPTTTDIGTTITALIVGIGGLLGALAAIMQSLGQRKELSKHKDALEQSASYLTDVSSHIKSSREDIRSLAEITYGFMPEKAQEIVNQQNVRLAELTKKLENAQSKLEKIPPALDHI